jgi:ATP-dependent Clp protease ATP-binding subunit ClpA
MFDRFTDEARKAMAHARKWAQHYRHDFIGTEHVLLGVVAAAGQVFKNLGIDTERIRPEVEARIQAGPGSPIIMGQLPFTPRAKRVLEEAMQEASELEHDFIGTGHLLLGLLREPDGVAAEVLQALGLGLDRARAEILKFPGYKTGVRPRRFPDLDRYAIELRDGADAVRARIAFTEDQQPGLSLFDQDGRERIAIRLEADGTPRIELRDAEGKTLFKAP